MHDSSFKLARHNPAESGQGYRNVIVIREWRIFRTRTVMDHGRSLAMQNHRQLRRIPCRQAAGHLY
jgi:hypothetical protein